MPLLEHAATQGVGSTHGGVTHAENAASEFRTHGTNSSYFDGLTALLIDPHDRTYDVSRHSSMT